MYATITLIILCILTSFYTWFIDPSSVKLLAFNYTGLLQGKLWTLATSLFIHGNMAHLLGNITFLYVFGSAVEEELGASKMLAAFFTGGMLTFLLSTPFYSPQCLLIGSSAAIFTLAAVAILVKPLKFSFLVLAPISVAALALFIYNVYAVAYGFSGNIAYISHIIGFLLGLSMGSSWNPEKWKINLLLALAAFALYIVFLWLLVGLLPFPC